VLRRALRDGLLRPKEKDRRVEWAGTVLIGIRKRNGIRIPPQLASLKDSSAGFSIKEALGY
jgi:hypothetical protein